MTAPTHRARTTRADGRARYLPLAVSDRNTPEIQVTVAVRAEAFWTLDFVARALDVRRGHIAALLLEAAIADAALVKRAIAAAGIWREPPRC